MPSAAFVPNWSSLSNLLNGLGQWTNSTAKSGEMLVEIPFELEQNRPFLSVRVNDSKPRRFLFDTGTAVSLIGRKTMAELGLLPTTNVAADAMPFEEVHGVKLAFSAASYLPKAVYLDAMESEQKLTDVFFEGVIGCDLLEEFVVEIDYRAKKMRLRNPASYKYSGSGDNLLILFDCGRPYVDATMVVRDGRQVKGQFLIDTGATGSLYLGREFADKYGLEQAAGSTVSGKSVRFDGIADNQIGRFTSLQLGHYLIEKPEVTFEKDHRFSGDVAGLIGGGILRRFKVILHYGRQQLTLEPNGARPRPVVTPSSGSQLLD
jgi:predicted aspartyl protease